MVYKLFSLIPSGFWENCEKLLKNESKKRNHADIKLLQCIPLKKIQCKLVDLLLPFSVNVCHKKFSNLLFQILIVAVIIVATFVIPISHLNQLHSGWIYATLVGNCLFIVLQMVCLIDSTGSICKNLDKIACRSRWWAFVEVKCYRESYQIEVWH